MTSRRKEVLTELEKKGHQGVSFAMGLLAGIVVTALVVVAGYGVGKGFVEDNRANAVTSQGKEDATASKEEDSIINDAFLKKVDAIETMIEERFYLADVDAETLREGAYKGIVEALDDVYSVYYTPEETEKVFQNSEGIYYGIGAYVQMDSVSGYVKISSVIEGAPAEEAGLKSEDIFYKADGEDLAGLDTTQVVSLIKGEEGTTVHLTMVRDGVPFEVDVERRKIESSTVEYSMLEDHMGYIQITEFDDVTVNQFEKALDAIKDAKAEGMILDLRANPGGNLSAVLDIADMLLGKGIILYTEDKQGQREEYYSDAVCKWNKPIVILVDGNSASASEVLSGALKDYGKATLVGTTTFGKGIVQTLRRMKDGSCIKLTISTYFTPAGNNIHGTGIEPDVVVEFDGDAYYGEQQFDNQLDKAKEVLREMLP